MIKAEHPMLSIITATLNVERDLPRLIQSLRAQSDKNFEWVVVDGLSTDGTLDLLVGVTDLNLTVSSQSDFGIYDALNRGIRLSKGRYYLVMGASDSLRKNAVHIFRNALRYDENIDILTARMTYKGLVRGVRRNAALLSNQFAYVSGHAVSTVFRTALHERFGYYSPKFPIAADALFIIQAARGGAKITSIEDVVGDFADDGLSHLDVVGALTEDYRIQLKFHPRWLCTVLFVLRLIKHYRKLK